MKPFRFTPLLKQTLWGGHRIVPFKKLESNLENVGESWEISGVPGRETIVDGGLYHGKGLNELIAELKEKLVGEANYKRFGNEFPLLIKFIDAAQDLSIQVHPDDALAKARHNSFGKTEMWYIMEADTDASIIIGFNKNVSREEYQAHLADKTLSQLLHYEKVKHGDMFFIPAGKIHAIGAGVLLAEIQQTSDITYRVYDFDRKDKNGNYRELHTELALDAIDFEQKDDFRKTYTKAENTVNPAVASPYFTTDYLKINQEMPLTLSGESFHIYMGVAGKGSLQYGDMELPLEKGQTVLVPACCKQISLKGDMEVLQVSC